MDRPPKLKTLLDIEQSLAASNQAGATELHLPSRLFFGGALGLQAAIIQLVITWARRNRDPTMRASGLEDEAFHRIHGTLAAYFAARLIDRRGRALSRNAVLQSAKPRIEAMFNRDYVDTEKGQSVALFCVGGALLEFLPTFYEAPDGSRLRELTEFLSEFERICAVALAGKARSVPKSFISAAGSLVYELFKNTHEHGLRDEFGNAYERHCRGLLVRYLKLNRSDIVRFGREDEGLIRYFARTYLSRTRSDAAADFLEISIVDSGPGLARRWISKHRDAPLPSVTQISLKEERDAVEQCFLAHSSTKPGSVWGVGLTQVTNALAQLEGFMRLRTGRLCLYGSPTKAQVNKPLQLVDWFPRYNVTEAEGAAYTIILPVSLKEREIR